MDDPGDAVGGGAADGLGDGADVDGDDGGGGRELRGPGRR